MKTDKELLKDALDLILMLEDWIATIPTEAVLPTMPGVDGYWAVGVVERIQEKLNED